MLATLGLTASGVGGMTGWFTNAVSSVPASELTSAAGLEETSTTETRPTTTEAPSTTSTVRRTTTTDAAPLTVAPESAPKATTASTTSTTAGNDTPPTTQTTTTSPPATTSPSTAAPTSAAVQGHEARGQAALASLGYQPSQIGWSISFHPGRDGVLGYTLTGEHHIQIFVRSSMSDSLLRHVIAHEIGHAVDVSLNSADDRNRWIEARGIQGAPWWPGDGATDFSTGAGDFAESFAAWQVGSGNFRSNLAGAPNGDQLALMASLASG